MAQSMPAWQRLVNEGWFDSRDEASRWILAGAVRAGGRPVASAGQSIKETDALEVRGLKQRYVGKGGLKLEGALAAFGIDVAGRVCIDAGASTGGFTDCLVQRGASLVYAVDVGYGQLAGKLRAHPSVVNLERTNIGDASLLSLSPAPTLGTVDLSYLSLRRAAPIFARILRGQGDLICLVKPLFEVEDSAARRSGVLSSDAYVPLLETLSAELAEQYAVRGITHSPVTGNHGTLEFFLWLSLDGPGGMPPAERRKAARCAVEAACQLPMYRKP